MIKNSVLLFLVSVIFFACEKDDFCTQNPVTPNLILRFYDDLDRETLKNVSSFYVWAEGKDTIFENVTTDSIYIPLNSLATETVYNLSTENTINKFTIKYTPKEEYVSRSCGYSMIFNEVTFSSNSSTWIKDFTPSSITTINNQNTAHVQIFH
jgi:hypothetical protein